MASHLKHMLKNISDEFETLTKEREVFLKPSPDTCAGFKSLTKKLYDAIIQANPLTDLKSNALSKLLIDGFDDEQVWQQIELQNKSAISHFENSSSKIDVNGLCLGINVKKGVQNGERSIESKDEEAMDTRSDNGDHLSDEESQVEDESEDLDDDDSDEYIDADKLENKSSSIKSKSDNVGTDDRDFSNELLEDDDSYPENNQESAKEKAKRAKKKYKSKVDDQFFKLSHLERFLRLEDLKEEKSRDEDQKEDESSDDDVDLFDDIPSSEEDSEEELDESDAPKKSSKQLMYNDFFDSPESDAKGSNNSSRDPTDDEDFEDGDSGEDDMENEAESDVESSEHTNDKDESQGEAIPKTSSKNKTPFQIQLEKTKEQIAMFEKGLLEPAPWHLTGEVDALKRPSEGLLDLQTDFDVNARPVVIEDKTLCEKLEDMLKNTIKNKAYSDGVRQYKTNNEIIAHKKEIVIEQNKSNKSLAQEYEDIYLKQKHNPEDEENPKHTAIKKLRDSLFPELQALFSHIPKPAAPEIKIVSNLPAISVEEVAPTSVSDVTLLAPEEIKKRTGLVKSVTERESTDKKRERRKKKALQKLKAKKREQQASQENPSTSRMKKKEKLETIKKLKQHRNTKIANVDGKRIKSSKDFFSHLQETVDSNAKQMPLKKKSK